MLVTRCALQYAVERHNRTRPRRLRAEFRSDGILIATTRVKNDANCTSFPLMSVLRSPKSLIWMRNGTLQPHHVVPELSGEPLWM